MRDFVANIEVEIMNNYIKPYVKELIKFLTNNSDQLNRNSSIQLSPEEFFVSERNAYIIILNSHNDKDIDKRYNYISSIYENLTRTSTLNKVFNIPCIDNGIVNINNKNIKLDDCEILYLKKRAVEMWIYFMENPPIEWNGFSI